MFPPLLMPGLMFHRGWAAIAYQMETEASTVADLLEAGGTATKISAMAEKVISTLSVLHGDRQTRQIIPRERWFPARTCEMWLGRLSALFDGLGDPALEKHCEEQVRGAKKMAQAVIDTSLGLNHGILDRGLQDDFVFVHGDCHGGNIMQAVDGRIFLIDLALAGSGLLSQDIAKLTVESLIRGLDSDLVGSWLGSKPHFSSIPWENLGVRVGRDFANALGMVTYPGRPEPLEMAKLHYFMKYQLYENLSFTQRIVSLAGMAECLATLQA